MNAFKILSGQEVQKLHSASLDILRDPAFPVLPFKRTEDPANITVNGSTVAALPQQKSGIFPR